MRVMCWMNVNCTTVRAFRRCRGAFAARWSGALSMLALACALLLVAPSHTQAQASVRWGEPLNLSNSPTSSNHPAIIADPYGFVHVFWSEDLNGREIAQDETPDPGATIMYRRWDGAHWTEARDIIAVPDDTRADFVAVALDHANQLHLIWIGMTHLYYSSAPAGRADDVRAWAPPIVIDPDSARTEYEADIAADARGAVHIVYATRGATPGVFHTQLAAGSTTWSPPLRISEMLRVNEAAFKDVRLLTVGEDQLHAVWSTANTNGYGQAIYYARSVVVDGSWSPAVMLADATHNTALIGFPSLVADGNGELTLLHVDESSNGRIERRSIDGGQSWSEPRRVIAEMEGVNGFLVPLLDGDQQLHLVINMRPSADQRTGIYAAPRAGLDWAPIVPVAVDAPYGPSAHYADAALRVGNEIHVVWSQLRGGEIWHVQGTIGGVAPLPVLPLPPAAVAVGAAPSSAASTPASTNQPAMTLRGTAQATLPWSAAPAPRPAALPSLIMALLPVLLFVVGAVFFQLRKQR